MQEMQMKIQKLEEELQKKDRIYKELQDQRESNPQEIQQNQSCDLTRSQTIQP